MQPIELKSADGKATAWACGACLSIRPKDYVEQCCKCSECGGELDAQRDYSTIHRKCSDDRSNRILANKLENAEEVPYEGGFVYSEGVGWEDGYADDMSYMLDMLADMEPQDRPEYVFACQVSHSRMCLDRILEDLTSDGYEDIYDPLEVPSELEAAIALFNERNERALQSWSVDYSRKYRVPLEDLKEAPND